MTPPKIQALGVTQEWAGTSWQASGYVEGIGWLEAWGPSLITAWEALQALAAPRGAEPAEREAEDPDSPAQKLDQFLSSTPTARRYEALVIIFATYVAG